MSRSVKKTMMKNSIDFMLYSYFSISVKDINSKDDIVRVAVEKAYEDATLMGAYKYKAGKGNKASDNSKRRCQEYLVNEHQIEALIRAESEKDFYESHKKICNQLVKKHKTVKSKNGDACFTYGNAQKWVNMTTKNLYVIAGLCDGWTDEKINAFCKDILCGSKNFHMPIDQIILRALLTLGTDENNEIKNYIYSNGDGVGCFEKEVAKNKIGYDLVPKHTRGIKKVAWSDFPSYDFYNQFRLMIKNAIPENKSPIEWECEAWIKQIKEDAQQKLEQKKT